MQPEQETIIQDEQVTSKPVIKAEDVAFGVIDKQDGYKQKNISKQIKWLQIKRAIKFKPKPILKNLDFTIIQQKKTSIGIDSITETRSEPENCPELEQAKKIILKLASKFDHWNNIFNNQSEQKNFTLLKLITHEINNAHKKLEKITTNLSENNLIYLKNYFRKYLNPYWLQGEISNRVIKTPNGYHGDYLTMELMYRNQFEGKTTLGSLLHKYVINDRSSQSVRLRRKYFAKKITTIIKNSKNSAILSIASGPATEIEDVLRKGLSPQKIVLLDQDSAALNYSINKLKNYLPSTTELIVIESSIINLIRNKKNILQGIGPFDYIFSAGLYDYLSDILAKKLTRFLFENLNQKGCLEFGNFTNFQIGFFAGISSDWKLTLRGKQEIKKFIPPDSKSDYFQIGDQVFSRVRK
jgi:hypothetical protein